MITGCLGPYGGQPLLVTKMTFKNQCERALNATRLQRFVENILVPSLVLRLQEAVTIQELGDDEGPHGHVERRACLLAFKQVGVVAHLYYNTHSTSIT